MDMEPRDWAIWKILEDQGRSLVWLAQQAGFAESHVKAVKNGTNRATPRFQEACAKVLHIRASILFSATPSELVTAEVA